MKSREVVLQVLKCSPNDYPVLLAEKFPHVLDKLVKLWGTPDIKPYFTDLLQPAGRGGGRMDRAGFPDKVWDEILHLKVLHDRAHPEED